MTGKLRVAPSELRASAHAQDTVADDVKKPSDRAVSDTDSAAKSLKSWEIGAGLEQIAESWKSGLKGLHSRLAWGAGNLRDTARTHEWNESAVSQDFEDFDGDYEDVIMSAPDTGPGLRAAASPPSAPSGAPDGAGHTFAPRPHGTGPVLDDFQDAQPAMPTYDGPDAIRGGPAPDTGPHPSGPRPAGPKPPAANDFG